MTFLTTVTCAILLVSYHVSSFVPFNNGIFIRAHVHILANDRSAMYNATYVEALQDALLAPIEDWPWIDCGPCAVHAACGDPNAPLNLDANLLMNYAFSALFAGNNRRVMTLNRLPGRCVCLTCAR